LSTHRRGISATQWPVADLLRREGRPWPSMSPTVRGLVVGSALLCSTVVAVSMAGEPVKQEQAPSPEPHSPRAAPPGSGGSVVAPADPSAVPGQDKLPAHRTAPRTSGALADGPAVVLVPPPTPSRPASRGDGRLALPDLSHDHGDDRPVDGGRIVAGALDPGRTGTDDERGDGDRSAHASHTYDGDARSESDDSGDERNNRDNKDNKNKDNKKAANGWGGSSHHRSKHTDGKHTGSGYDHGDHTKDDRSNGGRADGGHTKGDHPKSDHPKGDSAKGDGTKGDGAKGDSAKGDSANGDGAKGDSAKGDNTKKASKSDHAADRHAADRHAADRHGSDHHGSDRHADGSSPHRAEHDGKDSGGRHRRPEPVARS
jgi:hypothetical protein